MIWVIFILFSALARGIGDIFYKKLSFDFSPQTILLFSSFLNILFLVPTFGCIEVLEPKLMGFVFLKAVAMTTAWLLFLYSLKKTPYFSCNSSANSFDAFCDYFWICFFKRISYDCTIIGNLYSFRWTFNSSNYFKKRKRILTKNK